MKEVAVRLRPEMDMREELENLVEKYNISAGVLLSGVGGLSNARLRMPDGKTVREFDGPFEIVSATGTLSPDGCHIHMSVSDLDGQVAGGHLSKGNIVRTTVELVISVLQQHAFSRAKDTETGHKELQIDELE